VRIVRLTLLVLFLLPLPALAQRPAATEPSTAPVAIEHKTWLLHLPGMGGFMTIDRLLTSGLLQGGIEADLQIYDWTGADRGLASLTNVKRHEEQSRVVADLILQRLRQQPDAHVIITAHSAGTGIAVWALEKLPEDVMIDELVLIASALSPDYDLSRALRHVRHHAYAFNSELDVIVLGAGCRTMGTVDRVKTDAAGRVGFRVPEHPAVEGQYAKFVQYPYDPDWMRFRNNGEHIGPMMRPFAREVIASVIQGRGPSPLPTSQPTTMPATGPLRMRAAAPSR
jgi:pimeloyl-ACP methyl ester carboxylesterase